MAQGSWFARDNAEHAEHHLVLPQFAAVGIFPNVDLEFFKEMLGQSRIRRDLLEDLGGQTFLDLAREPRLLALHDLNSQVVYPGGLFAVRLHAISHSWTCNSILAS